MVVNGQPTLQAQARCAIPWCLFTFLLAVIAGCRAHSVDPAGCGPLTRNLPRRVVLAGQVAADTTLELSRRPLRSGLEQGRLAVGRLDAVARGIFGKRLALRLMGTPPALMQDCSSFCLADPVAVSLQPAHIELYPEGAEALAALEAVIDGATCRIDVLMFMWDHLDLGKEVAARLAAKAGPHLRVRILVDGGGNLLFAQPQSASTAEVNEAVCWLARQPYVELIRTRNPFGRLDHRKLVVADGKVAWTGGRNLTEVGFFRRHDVSWKLTGPLVGELEDRFEQFWCEQGGTPAEPLPPGQADPVNAGGRLVYTEPGERSLRQAVYQAVDGASHHVYLENPYPTDNGLIVKLAKARRRGVDVRVVLTVQEETSAINHANRVLANRLVRAGVRVYLYPGLLHTKALAVDGCRVYLGTGNFDGLSLRRNHELGVVIEAGPLIAEAEERLFLPDFRPEWELTAPLRLSPVDYFYEVVAGAFL